MTQTPTLYRSLVVEDDFVFRSMLIAVLQQADYIPSGTATGQETLTFLRQSDVLPDVILLDHQLPDMTATELYHTIRQDKRYHAVPVVLFSARSDTRELAEQMNLPWYLAKPFDPQALVVLVDELCGRAIR
jgi:DNA-binding response OmpR family regulator